MNKLRRRKQRARRKQFKGKYLVLKPRFFGLLISKEIPNWLVW